MANFDLDDPLGDLLSDGSDDSFFDNPKVQVKRTHPAKSPEKKSVSDLFGLDDKPKPAERTTRAIDDWLGLDTKKPQSSPVRPKPAKRISFEEDDTDILNTLGLDNKSKSESKIDSRRNDSAKKSSLMESILGPPKDDDKKFLSLDDLLKESKALKKQDIPVEVTQSASQLTEQKPTTAASSFGMSSLDAPREGRRGRARTANVSDPLGLLKTDPELPIPQRRETTPHKEEMKEPPTEVILAPSKESEKMKSRSDGNIADVPNWLGGSQIKKTDTIEKTAVTKTESELTIPMTTNHSLDNLVTQQKLSTSQIGYQNTAIALQQQESQLLMALQLRKYEENMTDMQKRQQEVLIKQEQQFNSLLDRQFTKQQIMENNMRLQQERINSHIQMLIAQPQVQSAACTEELEKIDELRKTNSDEISRQYEEIISHLKQRQNEELILLEESYKKQISTLEQSMDSVENHLKMELDSMMQKHREKLNVVEDEHKTEIEKYQKKIKDLHELHETEMKQMRENNNRVVEEIKYEYNTIIENLKNSKSMEHSILQGAHSYSDKLDSNLRLLDINSRSLIDIGEKVHSDYGILNVAREESIKAKQNEIDAMRSALEKSREAADQERAQLMSLVRNLEIKFSEQSQNSREERFAMQQAAATLVARTAAMDREADFNRQSLEREREQLKVLREAILAEQEKSLMEITDEKLKLHSEKVRIETASKLNENYDTQRAKAEVEAAIHVAKEAAAMTDKERENLMKQVRDVESLKRVLQDKESRLNNRERDLEVAMEHANRKNLLGEKALDDARMIQMNYNDKLREIQAQIASINARERKLAEDKISVSKERLALHSNARQIRRCGLCAVENHQGIIINEDDNMSEPVEQDIPRFISVSDADMFRLQLQMSEEQLTSVHADEQSSVFR